MFIKYPSNNDVAFKITVGHVIDQIVNLKATPLFDGYLMDIYMACRITRLLQKLKLIGIDEFNYLIYIVTGSRMRVSECSNR
jgi:hypothetical protein